MSQKISRLSVLLAVCVVAHGLLRAEAPTSAWIDNNEPFREVERYGKDAAKLNFRRSAHFRMLWGDGTGKEKDVNAEFKNVTEELLQGNLQMLEQLWALVHAAPPLGLGFPGRGEPADPATRDGKSYRANLIMNQAGLWTGGAWGSCDERGLHMFALPVGYLRFDPPSGATPHEYGHTVLINSGGFNDTPFDGMWHEAASNWIQLQFNNSYPHPGFAIQPSLSLPHGRNYYDAWMLLECLREDPRYGYAFISKLWTEARGNRAKGGEYMFDAMARLDMSGTPDGRNAIKDMLGTMAAKCVTWDYERGEYWRTSTPRTMDPFSEMYRRGYTELVRRGDDPVWFRVPSWDAPSQGGFNIVPLALREKKGAGYRVSLDLRPLWDAERRADVRATMVAVSDNGEARYSTMWNGGINSMTLSADENRLYLVVAATPDFMGFEGFSHPRLSDLPLQPQYYEVAFVDTRATAYESKPQAPVGVKGKAHTNGGGFVADGAKVDATAFVGPDALVLGAAQVLGNARLEDFAVAMDEAVVKDNAVVSGHGLVKDRAQVYGNAKVRDWATVTGTWKVYEEGRALERAFLLGNDKAELHGHATIKGVTCDYVADVKGHAIKDGDCANGVPVDHQVLTCWVWGFDQKYADEQPDCESLYCNYRFDRPSPILARDHYGIVHGYLVGGPEVVGVSEKALGNALCLNGKDQYVELRRDVADFADTTIALWVNWAGGEAEQRIFHLGDGGEKYARLTVGANATLEFSISAGEATGVQTLSGPALIPGVWTHVALTLAGDTGALYVDGKAVATDRALTLDLDRVLGPNRLSGSDGLYIGRGDKGGFFRGLLTDFRVYSIPREEQDIAKLAAAVSDRQAGIVEVARDESAPTVEKSGFLMPPTVVGATAVTMSASPAKDDGGQVRYRFVCTTDVLRASGWISSNRWTDCGVVPGKTYAYTYTVRDRAGNEMKAASASIAVPALLAPAPVGFTEPPRGLDGARIRMTAARAPESAGVVEYCFERADDKATSAWQASRTWIDTKVVEGAQFAYTVKVRNILGRVSSKSDAPSATAKDETPPARFRLGEWATLPIATLENAIFMRARNVTGKDGEAKIESDPVEYRFTCVRGGGPESGWIGRSDWRTPPLPDGEYVYCFTMRDAAGNETPASSEQTTIVSTKTGYHDVSAAGIAALDEDTLVTFKGQVAAVEPNAYIVEAGGARVKVIPKTPGGETDAALAGKSVTVKGCTRTRDGETQVTWAEVNSGERD